MNLTDALRGEHGVFYAQFTHLEQTVPSVEELAVLKSQAAMLAAALATHAQLEEELLFRALDPHLGEGGPLSMMRAEHEEIEQALAQIPGLVDLAETQRRVLHVVEFARQHFAKEEQVLFRLAAQSLGDEMLRDLGAKWAERRGVMI
ncbi:MAG: hemerythrin domain-containing protein [Anaerolineales bacterium]